jgi:hypothetical protein
MIVRSPRNNSDFAEDGDTRYNIRMPILPVKLEDGTWAWFQKILVYEKYDEGEGRGPNSVGPMWHSIRHIRRAETIPCIIEAQSQKELFTPYTT